MEKTRLIGDSLFYIQILAACSFGFAQAWLMFSTTEGVIFTWLAFWGVFLAINLSLSVRAHQVKPSRITKQTVIVYAIWTLIMSTNVLVFLWHDTDIWNEVDTLTSLLATAGIALTLVIGRLKRLPLMDPLVRGYLAVFFKALPQFTLAYSIWQDGGDGISVVGVLIGHITICTRLGQIFLSLREAGWDRNRQGSAISEVANEISLIAVTIVWLIRL